jgi:hypothetical protein
MASDPNAPTAGTGEPQGESKWEEAGFDNEDAMLEAAKAAVDLKAKIAEAEAALKKEREAKSKTDSEYMRQAQEIGTLRKQLKESGKNTDDAPDKDDGADEVLESLSQEEVSVLDGVLNDPKNAELKRRVALGGSPAMAEFVKAYRTEAPVDLSVSLFGSLKKKKSDTVPAASIAKAVKELFAQHSIEERNNLAATPQGGAHLDRMANAKKQMVVGGVGVDFFKKQ